MAFYGLGFPTSTLAWSRRSARVRCLPHSHPKKVLSERHTERGPPSTVRSPHSSHMSTTFSEEPFMLDPPPLLRRHQPPSHVNGGSATSTSVGLTQVLWFTPALRKSEV